eukprot:gene35551-47912_t
MSSAFAKAAEAELVPKLHERLAARGLTVDALAQSAKDGSAAMLKELGFRGNGGTGPPAEVRINAPNVWPAKRPPAKRAKPDGAVAAPPAPPQPPPAAGRGGVELRPDHPFAAHPFNAPTTSPGPPVPLTEPPATPRPTIAQCASPRANGEVLWGDRVWYPVEVMMWGSVAAGGVPAEQ